MVLDVQKNVTRSVTESVIASMQEVALMRAGKIKKPTLDELFDNIKIWAEEADEECTK